MSDHDHHDTPPEKEEDPAEIEARALKLLTRREHSRQELYFKLIQRQFSSGAIETVLNRLEDQGWLDDERFAQVFVRHRVEQGYGPLRILADLQQKGVHWQPEALSEVTSEQWLEQARAQRQRRFSPRGPLSWQEQGRQGRFLSRRGFTREQVEAVLNEGAGDGP
ncbi:MAG: regulatory protein RecX [Oleiphilaceae bacterium]|nr:regulatory protein RecX [Oleiphilaceae bacterium]